MSSEVIAYVGDGRHSYLFELVEKMCSTVSAYFPFSTIEAHAVTSTHPHSIYFGMTVLWLLSPAIFFGSISRYSKFIYINKNKNKIVSFRLFSMICMLGIAMGVFSLLYFMPDANSSLCRSCETKTIFLAIFIKYIYFWMIGFCVGQIFSALKKRKAWYD